MNEKYIELKPGDDYILILGQKGKEPFVGMDLQHDKETTFAVLYILEELSNTIKKAVLSDEKNIREALIKYAKDNKGSDVVGLYIDKDGKHEL